MKKAENLKYLDDSRFNTKGSQHGNGIKHRYLSTPRYLVLDIYNFWHTGYP